MANGCPPTFGIWCCPKRLKCLNQLVVRCNLGTDIIVPSDLPVTASGASLLGGREVKLADVGTGQSTSGKSLHVAAFAILGGVAVKPPKKS